MYTYLLINILSVLFPFIFSFHPKIGYSKTFRELFIAMLATDVFFIAWDVTFTKMGIWGFNPKYLTGAYFINLPIEEVLFFICIPFSSIFIYEILKKYNVPDYFKNIETIITRLLIILSVIILINFYNRWYTAITFSLLALFLIFYPQSLSRFYFAYLIILIPFFIVNGLLTGTGLDEPVVWYNNNHNMGIRISTIPVEDVFYGMLMLLMNMSIFEGLRK